MIVITINIIIRTTFNIFTLFPDNALSRWNTISISSLLTLASDILIFKANNNINYKLSQIKNNYIVKNIFIYSRNKKYFILIQVTLLKMNSLIMKNVLIPVIMLINRNYKNVNKVNST